ncbi:hypothetical protein MGN70_009186 [Eutypa lata]|uniref:Putative benzoate 4-monooxygenase cytochrome p450 protein n=1 Tax=Eutypa lata (strain UCR-EL1) TaxID=1287681 RepID=M7TQY1_EUTLA|nr:putative benzoate 4-monooxygenase cytochrome p450 protein [Eutypa lata UCREL1]KAI1249573.1 hypothetical protein MGN70_009186 [Eutypa lata]
MAQDIYNNPAVTKSRAYLGARVNYKPTLFDELDQEQHRRKRKIIGSVINERSMRTFEPTMSEQVDVFLRELLSSSRRAEAVNMTARCQRLGADVVGHLAFGYPLKTQTEESKRVIPRAISLANARIAVYMAWPITSFAEQPLRWLARKKAAKYYEAVQTMIHRRMAMGKDEKHDLYSAAAGAYDAGEDGLRGTELWSEAIFFINAGGTTTTTLMCAMFFYLARNPSAYSHLAMEIRSAFSSGSDICSGHQLADCKYLRAVIDESLRISPPSVGTLWREQTISCTDPLVVDGHIIPRGTSVAVNLYSLMHNAAYFPDPFSFCPERWLEAEGEGPAEREARATARHAFAPFALGDRGCAGKSMAYLEASLTLARTIWYFDFEKAPGEPGKLGEGEEGRKDGRHRTDEFQLYDIVTADHDGPNLVFRPRGDYWNELDLDEGE